MTPDWYSQSFGETYHRLHDHPFLDYRARSEAESIQSLLGERGTRILDLCCGWGSHSAALARLGYRVTGFDLSAHFLEKARATINKEGLDVELIRGDMRDLPFREQFDAVVFLGNSFGYFEDEADDLRTLEQVHKALKPGGTLLLQTANREAFIRTFQRARATRMPDDLFVVEERDIDLLCNVSHLKLTEIGRAGQRTSLDLYMRMYALHEIAGLCARAGLPLERHFGSLRGTPLTLDDNYLVAVCRKAK